ncbi:sigma-70 family RNA polymerase sigma factor [Catenovulum maritimum]|uniref:sigma-70 family RNA polymerase sigma factor n=1 Tax=Catenovulum maritimum TaxID=1513271 RepID=UPI00098FE320|nr:sigma-70 family RNA polymerase sigma factor [Catenovulum maritimum]
MPLNQSNKIRLSENNPSNLASIEGFEALFEADKNRLYRYIYASVWDSSAADDIFQETSLTLWNEFSKFEPGSDFSKWATCIAFNRIRAFKRRQNKYQLGLEDDLLQEFSNNLSILEENTAAQEVKWRHLEHCYTLLPPPMQKIYQYFYNHNLMAQEIADQSGRSIYAIRKAIHKLRKKLFDCVEQKISGEKK